MFLKIFIIILFFGGVVMATQADNISSQTEQERLLTVVKEKSRAKAAEAIYQNGLLAEANIDHVTAMQDFREAISLAPTNKKYQEALQRLLGK